MVFDELNDLISEIDFNAEKYVFYFEDMEITEDSHSPHMHDELEIKITRNKFDGRLNITIIAPGIIHCGVKNDSQTDLLSFFLNEKVFSLHYNFRIIIEGLACRLLKDYAVDSALIFDYIIKKPLQDQHLSYLLSGLFSATISFLSHETSSKLIKNPVRKTVEYIERFYYRNDLSVDEIAEHVELTPNYLVSLFRREQEMTIRQYLVKTRLLKGRKLLASGNLLIKDVARLTGWSNQYYFSNAYRKYFKEPPSSRNYQ